MSERKPILCLDFDGVPHRYDSGWKGADVIPDPMTDGAAEFLAKAVDAFRVAIYSSRSGQPMGIEAMQVWLRSQLYRRMDQAEADHIFGLIEWPREKPPAMVTLDDEDGGTPLCPICGAYDTRSCEMRDEHGGECPWEMMREEDEAHD